MDKDSVQSGESHIIYYMFHLFLHFHFYKELLLFGEEVSSIHVFFRQRCESAFIYTRREFAAPSDPVFVNILLLL